MDERDTPPTVGARIRTLREKMHWSQSRLCKDANVERSWLSLVEIDMTKSPRAVMLDRVARALGTTSHYLITGEETNSFILDGPVEPGSEEDLNWFARLPTDRRRAVREMVEVFHNGSG